MVTYITAQYRHVVVCSGLYLVRSQSLHGGYSSGCIESAMQPSFTEKSSRTICITSYEMTVHVILSYPPCTPSDVSRNASLMPRPHLKLDTHCALFGFNM